MFALFHTKTEPLRLQLSKHIFASGFRGFSEDHRLYRPENPRCQAWQDQCSVREDEGKIEIQQLFGLIKRGVCPDLDSTIDSFGPALFTQQAMTTWAKYNRCAIMYVVSGHVHYMIPYLGSLGKPDDYEGGGGMGQ